MRLVVADEDQAVVGPSRDVHRVAGRLADVVGLDSLQQVGVSFHLGRGGDVAKEIVEEVNDRRRVSPWSLPVDRISGDRVGGPWHRQVETFIVKDVDAGGVVSDESGDGVMHVLSRVLSVVWVAPGPDVAVLVSGCTAVDVRPPFDRLCSVGGLFDLEVSAHRADHGAGDGRPG